MAWLLTVGPSGAVAPEGPIFDHVSAIVRLGSNEQEPVPNEAEGEGQRGHLGCSFTGFGYFLLSKSNKARKE